MWHLKKIQIPTIWGLKRVLIFLSCSKRPMRWDENKGRAQTTRSYWSIIFWWRSRAKYCSFFNLSPSWESHQIPRHIKYIKISPKNVDWFKYTGLNLTDMEFLELQYNFTYSDNKWLIVNGNINMKVVILDGYLPGKGLENHLKVRNVFFVDQY